MAGFNKVILVGNMTRDVEIRTLPSGSMVGGFGIAINRRMRLATGEEREEVCFVDCTAFDKKADILRQYTRKGSLILVEGRLRLDAWTDKTTGQPRSKLNVVVENIQLLDKRDPNAQQGGYQQAPGGWGQAQGGYQQPQA
ncbi:MAG: single-stranded DNA-binding protein, partial [Victivallales bacterium]|nr:single-stranded DNA-binding protein [Victivallales bacterium]